MVLTRWREAAAAGFGRHKQEMGRGSRIAFAVAVAALATGSVTAAAGSWPKLERNAADQALAGKAILHLTDFAPGSGWTIAPTGGSGNLHDPACGGPAFSDEGRVLTGRASSSFRATGLQVWSSAEVMKTLAMAQRDAGKTTSSAVVPCITALLRKGLPKEARLVSVHRLAFPRVGDWSDAYRALVDVTVNGTKLRMQVDLVLVLRSRVEITLMQLAPFVISSQAKSGEVRMVQRLAGASLVA
jgi:hypothetical protein